MNSLYNGAVAYERIKYGFISFVTGLLGVCVICCAISAIATSMSSVNSKPTTNATNNNENTPSPPPQNSYIGGSILSCFGCILLLFSSLALYMSTSTSKANEHILAAQGVGDAVGAITSVIHKRGGYFKTGE